MKLSLRPWGILNIVFKAQSRIKLQAKYRVRWRDDMVYTDGIVFFILGAKLVTLYKNKGQCKGLMPDSI